MGRKGVSKRKRAKEKVKPVAKNSASSSQKSDNQPEQATEKSITWSRDNSKCQA
jgi:hypothetical protein